MCKPQIWGASSCEACDHQGRLKIFRKRLREAMDTVTCLGGQEMHLEEEAPEDLHEEAESENRGHKLRGPAVFRSQALI